jgi:hypothetical protein
MVLKLVRAIEQERVMATKNAEDSRQKMSSMEERISKGLLTIHVFIIAKFSYPSYHSSDFGT